MISHQRILLQFGLLLLTWGLVSCYSISRLPNSIPPGSDKAQVIKIMGAPDYQDPPPIGKAPYTGSKQTWTYWDEWHRQDKWSHSKHPIRGPKQPARWGSWNLYFDYNGKYEGWRMIEPVPSADFARERFWINGNETNASPQTQTK